MFSRLAARKVSVALFCVPLGKFVTSNCLEVTCCGAAFLPCATISAFGMWCKITSRGRSKNLCPTNGEFDFFLLTFSFSGRLSYICDDRTDACRHGLAGAVVLRDIVDLQHRCGTTPTFISD